MWRPACTTQADTCWHQPHSNKVTVQKIQPSVKYHSDSGTDASVQASSSYVNITLQIVTEISGTASEDKILVIIKIVKSVNPMKLNGQ